MALHVYSRPGERSDLRVATLAVPGHAPLFTVVECQGPRTDVVTAPFEDPEEADASSAWIAREYRRLDA